MENLIDEKDIKNIMNIYLLNGNSKESWDLLNLEINKDNSNEKIIFYLKNKINEDPNNELNLDIIDFIIDKGSNSFLDKIFQKDFLDFFTNKTIEINNNNSKIKDKSLFLIKKWVDKFKDKYILLLEKYNKYKNEGQIFPDIIFKTYNNYIQIDENKNNNEENKELYDFNNIKVQINNIENNINNENINKKNDEENNTNFNSLDNPFEENYDNLFENIDFPEDDKFENKFSNLRTSEIPTYFKTLRSKSIVENTTNLKANNPNQNNAEGNNENNIIKESNENNNIKQNNEKIENNANNDKINNNQNKKEIKKVTNMNEIFNNCKNDNYTSTFRNYKTNPILFQNKWNEKIISLNKWIKEGKNSKNFELLKEGIKQLLIGLDEIEEIIQTCAKIGDNEGRSKVSCIKSDMEQTCYRYECLLQGKKVEKFKSSFDGNVKKYYFYKPGLLEENNININDIEEEKKEKKMKKFGRAIKNGFLKVGKKIKSNSKEKVKSLDNIGILDNE